MLVIFATLWLVVFGCECEELHPLDCSEIYEAGEQVSGIYSIYPTADRPVWTQCDMISSGEDEEKGGWTVHTHTHTRHDIITCDMRVCV